MAVDTAPAVGSRWSVLTRHGHSIYELTRFEPGDAVLTCIAQPSKTTFLPGTYLEVGQEMRVDPVLWFSVRGAMPAKAVGAVRRVA